MVWALAVSCLGLSVYAIIQKFTGFGIANEIWRAEATRRVTSVFPYPNALALYLTPLVFVFLGYLSSLIKKKASFFPIFFLSATIILSLVSVYFARSEGALVASAAGVLLFLWLIGGKWRWFAYGVVIGVLSFLCFYPVPREKVVEKATLSDLSGEIRKQQWEETWHMLKREGIFWGVGLHNYQSAIGPYHQPGIFYNKNDDPDFKRKIILFNEEYKQKFWQPVEIYLYPHNIFLNFWTELGMLGMLVFIWIIGKFITKGVIILRQVRNEERYKAAGLTASMAVIIVHGLVDVPYFKNDLAAMFWLLVALMSLIYFSSFSSQINNN